MKQRRPGLDQLTVEVLQETVDDLLRLGISIGSWELALAQTIILNTLGGDFWAKECTTFGEKQEFFAQKSEVRVIQLANALWNLKACSGFRDFLTKNDTSSFESTYYESVIAHLFLKESRSVEFIIPSKKRGDDFDIAVTGFKASKDYNVEVKARRKSFDTEQQATNFLKSCRTQLPPNQSGIIFCKLAINGSAISQEALGVLSFWSLALAS